MSTTEFLYWFGVTAVFKCQVCGREAIERMSLTQVRRDLSEIRQTALSRIRRCQNCHAPLTAEQLGSLYVLPGTRSHLKNKGFPVPVEAEAAKTG